MAGDGGTIIAGLGAGTGITNVRDMDKTNSVTVAGDRGITIANLGTLNRLQIPLAGPFAPVGAGPAVSLSASPATATTGTSSGDSNPGVRNIRDSGVASGLASSRRILNSPGQLPAWVVDRLRMLDLNSGPIADYFQRLHDEGTPRAKAILVKADKIADALGLDDEFLDSLLDDLGLE